MLPCVCSGIDHRWRQNVVRTRKWHTRRSRVCHWCSYHILTSSVIYYWTDARQHGIYLFYIIKELKYTEKMPYVCLTTRCYTTSHFHQDFFDFARIFSLFSLIYSTWNFWNLRNLMKQLFHSRLLDMRLVIANWAVRASLAIYHLISNARSWNNC